MDIESAISRLKLLFSDASNEDYPYTELFGEAVNEGIQALEKQVVKKPIETSFGTQRCPCCNEKVGQRVTKTLYEDCYAYCWKCGQKLDWSDKNEK